MPFKDAMMRITLSKRERYIFITAIAILFLALAYNFIFEPMFKKWVMLDKEIIVKKTRLRKDLKLLQNRNEIIAEYNTHAARVKNISKILGYIEKQALSSGIRTSNIRPRPAVQNELWTEYVIELQIDGNLEGIKKFLEKIAEPPVFITVSKFDLRAAKDSPSSFKGTLILSNLLI